MPRCHAATALSAVKTVETVKTPRWSAAEKLYYLTSPVVSSLIPGARDVVDDRFQIWTALCDTHSPSAQRLWLVGSRIWAVSVLLCMGQHW